MLLLKPLLLALLAAHALLEFLHSDSPALSFLRVAASAFGAYWVHGVVGHLLLMKVTWIAVPDRATHPVKHWALSIVRIVWLVTLAAAAALHPLLALRDALGKTRAPCGAAPAR